MQGFALARCKQAHSSTSGQLLYRPTEDPGEGCVFLWVEVFGRQDNGEVGHLHMTQAQKHTELSYCPHMNSLSHFTAKAPSS